MADTHFGLYSKRDVFCFDPLKLRVAEDAKVGPAEEMEELERRRKQLDAEITQLEEESVLCSFLVFFFNVV